MKFGNDEEYIVGTIDFGPANMQEEGFGQINLHGVCTIKVNAKEGTNEPHFHICKKGEPDCCVSFCENKYFIHGKNTGKIRNGKDKRKLDAYLRERIQPDVDFTRWDSMVQYWNMCSYSPTARKIPPVQPNYSTITESIHEATVPEIK